MQISIREGIRVLLERSRVPTPNTHNWLSVQQRFQRFVKAWFRTVGAGVVVLLAVLCCAVLPAKASDHQDTTFLATKLTAADLTDLYVFESPNDPSKVVLAMDFDPLITKGEVRPFDPAVLYQFKVDNTGDGVEDLVLQFQVVGTGPNQRVIVRGPSKPDKPGTESKVLLRAVSGSGPLNQPFTAKSLKVFMGLRKDPFFFDLEQFFKIIPDRNSCSNPIRLRRLLFFPSALPVRHKTFLIPSISTRSWLSYPDNCWVLARLEFG